MKNTNDRSFDDKDTKMLEKNSKTSNSKREKNVVIGRKHHPLTGFSHQSSPPPWYYSAAITLMFPIYRGMVWQRSRNNENYAQEIADRFGSRYDAQQPFAEESGKSIVWCHAVSLGETNTVAPLLKRLLEQGYYIWLTSTTQTGYARVKKLFRQELIDGTMEHSYMPVDTKKVISQFINHIRPQIALFVETELWANTLYQLSGNNIISILVNARLSEKSYQNYLKIAQVSRSMMNNLTLIIAQDPESAKRFRLLGADSAKIRIAGSLKWTVNTYTVPSTTSSNIAQKSEDLISTDHVNQLTNKKTDIVIESLPELIKSSMKKIIQKRPVWIAASTHLGEESVALESHSKLIKQAELKDALLIIVPRHPERFDEVADTIAKSGLTFCRRSKLKFDAVETELAEKDVSTQDSDVVFDDTTQVFLADSMGELAIWYELAKVAFVGGSMVNVGGHNPIEALIAKSPVIMGKYTYSLDAIFEQLSASGVLTSISVDYDHVKGNDIEEVVRKKLSELLYAQIKQWLLDLDEANALGEKGYSLVQENQEVIEKQLQMILQMMHKLE